MFIFMYFIFFLDHFLYLTIIFDFRKRKIPRRTKIKKMTMNLLVGKLKVAGTRARMNDPVLGAVVGGVALNLV